MLSPADAQLVQRDPQIAGLSLLLDPVALLNRLRAGWPGGQLSQLQAIYVRYKPGTSCLVQYQLRWAGGETTVYAKGLRRDAPGKLRKARLRLSAARAPGPGGVILDDVAVVVYAFPNDHDLEVMARLAVKESRQRLLTKVLPDRPDLWPATLHTLRYRPERRYLAKVVTGTETQALLRAYDRADYGNARRAAKAIASCGALQVAQRLGRSNRHQIVVVEWLPGQSLDRAMREPGYDQAAGHSIGEALAVLHSLQLKGLQRLSREVERNRLLSTARDLSIVHPDLEHRIERLAAQLATRLEDVDAEPYALHGDFAADQVLLNDRGVAFVDLDAAAQGDPMLDLGSFRARLELDVLRGELPADRARTLADAVVAGYSATTRRPLPLHLDLYVAAGLLRLAPHPFRYREPDWPQRTEAILERAEVIAAEAGGG